jgi:D-arabinitol dehydrogenase (NADP+)
LAAPTQFKLDAAKELGIRETLQISRSDYGTNKKLILEKYPRGFDIVIDATGSAEMAGHCLEYTKRGSRIVLYGVYGEDAVIPISPYLVFSQELSLIGSCAQTHCFPRALQYLTNGTLQVNKLVTHHFRLEEYQTALDTVIDGKKSMKVIINP